MQMLALMLKIRKGLSISFQHSKISQKIGVLHRIRQLLIKPLRACSIMLLFYHTLTIVVPSGQVPAVNM